MNQYFLYARKSTDVEDKQVLSIEAQLAELRTYAANEHLSIIEEIVEKQSAKSPGRPLFNDMMSTLEKGEANGIVSWNPDRSCQELSVDGGKIIYLLDTGRISTLKFPTFWFESTPQGKFMLNIAFGQSKYYVDSLAENTKRGLRQKVRRGEYPSRAPFGYLNDSRTKTISRTQEKLRSSSRQSFELYSHGDQRTRRCCQLSGEIWYSYQIRQANQPQTSDFHAEKPVLLRALPLRWGSARRQAPATHVKAVV